MQIDKKKKHFRPQYFTLPLIEKKKQVIENPSHHQQKKKTSTNKIFDTYKNSKLLKMGDPGKGEIMRSRLQKASSSHHFDVQFRQPIHKKKRHFRLQDEEDYHEEEYGTMESFSPHPTTKKHYEEEHQEQELEDNSETNASEDQRDENIGSTMHDTSTTITRGESRALTESRKRRLNKGKLVFEVDECAGRIVGDDSQTFITKAGCVVRKNAKFDGTTWKKQSPSLKSDIIDKCMENSNYDPNCRFMVQAIQSQLGSQHRSRQYRLHQYYKSFSTKEEATTHPPNGIRVADWVNLCERFASDSFKKTSIQNTKNRSFNEVPPAVGTVSIARVVNIKMGKGEEVSAIDRYKIAHYSKKKNQMVNDKANEIWMDLCNEEASSSSTSAEICLKKLHRIPGYGKGRLASTKQFLETENLRTELELEKEKSKVLEEKSKALEEKSKALEEKSKALEEKVEVITKDHNSIKEQMGRMMEMMARLTKDQSQASQSHRCEMSPGAS